MGQHRAGEKSDIYDCVIVPPRRTHMVQRCGLLLPIFRGFCVSPSVGRNHELCENG